MFDTLFDQVMQVMSTSDALFHRVLLAVIYIRIYIYIYVHIYITKPVDKRTHPVTGILALSLLNSQDFISCLEIAAEFKISAKEKKHLKELEAIAEEEKNLWMSPRCARYTFFLNTLKEEKRLLKAIIVCVN